MQTVTSWNDGWYSVMEFSKRHAHWFVQRCTLRSTEAYTDWHKGVRWFLQRCTTICTEARGVRCPFQRCTLTIPEVYTDQYSGVHCSFQRCSTHVNFVVYTAQHKRVLRSVRLDSKSCLMLYAATAEPWGKILKRAGWYTHTHTQTHTQTHHTHTHTHIQRDISGCNDKIRRRPEACLVS